MARDMVQVRRGPRKSYSGPDVKIGRSQFNRSHGLKVTFDASYLIPILVDDVLPGDTFTCKLNGFARVFSPLEAPIMDNIELETFFFFVPNRLVWSNWEAFNGAHDQAGAQDTDFTIPVIQSTVTVDHGVGTGVANLLAYMGLPHGLAAGTAATEVEVNVLPLRMYNLIYNEWFRDQNLIDEVTVSVDNGPEVGSNFAVRKSAKKHDYFTSALPYLQKGDAQAAALSGQLRVQFAGGDGVDIGIEDSNDSTFHKMDVGVSFVDQSATLTGAANVMFVDLADSVGVDINALRQSVAIQRLLERDARGGTRYTEIIKSHFGVTSPDFRLQRPEYLGGGKAFINVSPVANTSATATEDQGELRGIGTGVIRGHGWAKSFTEHGYVIGLVRARGDITYFQGIDRHWSRSTRYDFYIPALANLGEQAVLNKEIFVSNVLATDDGVFGYQERWSEYRMKHSRLAGKFNPDVAGALSFWHLAEDFSALPALNQTFVEDQTPMSRVTVVDSEPDFMLDVWFDFRCARPIPVYSIPSLVARF